MTALGLALALPGAWSFYAAMGILGVVGAGMLWRGIHG